MRAWRSRVGGHRRLAHEDQPRVEAPIGLEVARHDAFRFRERQPRHHREALRADAVDDAEVQSLGEVALLLRHLIERNVEDLRGGHAMQVCA